MSRSVSTGGLETIDPTDSPSRPALFKHLITLIGVALAVYLCYATVFGPYRATLVHYAIFLGASLVIYFLGCRPLSIRGGWLIDLTLAAVSVAATGYIVVRYDHVAGIIGAPFLTLPDTLVGVALILLVLEAVRRQSVAFLLLAIICIAYTLGGKYMPGLFQHPGIGPERFIFLNAFGSEGIFGIGLSVATNYLFMFVLFGAALKAAGTSDYLLQLARHAVGRFAGGPAKVSLFGSALMGTVLGSSIANVVMTGAVTIPIMVKSGYKPHEAAAIEVLNSEGAQLVPPVLGAAAFIMAEITGVPYRELVIASVIPAALYYLSAFFVIHFEARKSGIGGMESVSISLWQTFKQGWHLLIPIVTMFWLIVEIEVTPAMAGLVSICTAIIIAQLKRNTRLSLKQIVEVLSDGARNASLLTGLIASIGLVQQALTITGLGARATEILLAFSGGTKFGVVLIATAITILLGMGLPTPIAYVLAAIFVAPTMTNIRFSLLAVHMFLFFFAIKSGSTPPVAIVSVVAAAIAKADWWKTAWLAFLYSVPGWIVAFAFLYSPTLLLQGNPESVVESVITASIGVVAIAAALSGYLNRRLGISERILLTVGALCLIAAGPISDAVGIACVIVAISVGYFRQRNQRETLMP
jgi:TRAP transporter 4TM/12TM fusion protein